MSAPSRRPPAISGLEKSRADPMLRPMTRGRLYLVLFALVAIPFAAVQWRMDAHPSLIVDVRANDAEGPTDQDSKAVGCAPAVDSGQGRPDGAGVTATLAELRAAPSFAYPSRTVRDADAAWDDDDSPYR